MAKEYQRQVHVISQIPFPAEPILADSFEDMKKVRIGGAGADYEGYLSPYRVLSGNFALRMLTKETTPTSGDYVHGIWYAPLIPSRHILISSDFFIGGDAGNSIAVILEWLTENEELGGEYYFKTKLECNTGKIYVETASGVWTEIAEVNVPYATSWHRFSMIIDQIDGTIESCCIGNEVIDVNTKGYLMASSNYLRAELTITLQTLTNSRGGIYLDNVIVRASEIT